VVVTQETQVVPAFLLTLAPRDLRKHLKVWDRTVQDQGRLTISYEDASEAKDDLYIPLVDVSTAD
jgi:hypothetical protein